MGGATARAWAAEIEEGHVQLDVAVWAHLQGNHFPPHPAAMVEPAVAAIRLAHQDLLDEDVQLPEGIEHKRYGQQVPAEVLINDLHLQAFV